jgi:hypothetical protein
MQKILVLIALVSTLVYGASWNEEPPKKVQISEIPEGTEVLNENAMAESWHRHYNQYGAWDYYCHKAECCLLDKGFDEDEYTCAK